MKKTITLLLALVTFSLSAQCWQNIAKGTYFTLAQKTDGTLWGWGYNQYGQLGDGSNANRSLPTQIGGANNWIKIAAGGSHSLGIRANGSLWSWGYNNQGQLGDGSSVTYRNTPQQVGTATNWAFVAAGDDFSFAIKTDGTLWAWGRNNYCQLGDATYMNQNVPVQVGTANNWTSVSAGMFHAVGIRSNGTLWAWGRNNRGQLGDGSTTNREEPVQIGTGWQQVDAGDEHTIGKKTNGTIFSWGYGFLGRLGLTDYDTHTIPTQIGTESNWQSVAAGDEHSYAIKTNGTLWACGYGHSGQLGNNSFMANGISVFQQIGTSTGYQQVFAGKQDGMTIRANNLLYGWGGNHLGQLGDGTTSDKAFPVAVGCYNSVLAVDQNQLASDLKLYPNPVGATLHFTSAQNIGKVAIYNVLGQQMSVQTVQGNEGQVDTAALSAGTYYVKIESGNQTQTYKIIKA